ncbi:hypothetical protein A8139_05600 [Marinomonas primoryensis]|uniref:Uncharacterized protein n=1 Tax=Marinomonas primoryensis TaxID=178399 RepID=A0A2Z4PPS6_9GAMM|nr:hypothetical protein [Marinomonas primoryensis]AWX99525.1 hypothetical protein A8139_05600 [Marinomonas primoryensis]
MHNAIVRSQHHHALLPSIGTSFAIPSPQVGLGRIVAVCVDSETPLLVRLANGTTFHLGGLSDRQTQQLPNLMPDLIGSSVWFQYDESTTGQVINPRFKTILIQGDSRQKTRVMMNTNLHMRVVHHG